MLPPDRCSIDEDTRARKKGDIEIGSKTAPNRQLALELRLDQHARFETFVADGNEAVVAHLLELGAGARKDVVWLTGEPGAGKTHLLQALCHRAGESGRRAIWLDGRNPPPPDALSGLGELDLVAIDDVEGFAGELNRERSLFAVFNDFYRCGGSLVVASSSPPATAGFVLADLASRAAGAVVYRLEPLADEFRPEALARLAKLRGMDLDSKAAGYLLRRVRRDMREVGQWLDAIDRAALAAQRRITVPLVRDVLRSGTVDTGTEPSSES